MESTSSYCFRMFFSLSKTPSLLEFSFLPEVWDTLLLDSSSYWVISNSGTWSCSSSASCSSVMRFSILGSGSSSGISSWAISLSIKSSAMSCLRLISEDSKIGYPQRMLLVCSFFLVEAKRLLAAGALGKPVVLASFYSFPSSGISIMGLIGLWL